MDPSAAPNMTLSIGHFSPNSDIVRRDAAMAIMPSQAITKNTGKDVCNNSQGVKRKRGQINILPHTEISSLSSENDRASEPSLGFCNANPSPCNSSFSTGNKTGTADEGPPMSLGLALTGPSSHSSENGCITSFLSGGRSVLTSADIGTRKFANINSEPESGAGVHLGLGPSHCHLVNTNSAGGARKVFKAANNANLFGSDLGMQLQLGLSRSSVTAPDDDHVLSMSSDQGDGVVFHDTGGGIWNELTLTADDEGSTSARTIRAGGYMPSLVMCHRLDGAFWFATKPDVQHAQVERDLVHHQAFDGELGSSYTQKERKFNDFFMDPKTPSLTTSTSGPSATVDRTPKTCKFQGCGKGARGASGLCITHGGGRRCQRPGCNKGAEGRTVYCKSHGGGRRCQSLGCTKSAEGKTDYCIGHGGGRRCSQNGCSKAARGRSGLCIRHGGGKRCKKEGCTKSAEGYSGLCISHGGGRRCQAEGCGKGAQGSTLFCKAHGGGKRCMIQGCTKGAEGSTPLCKGHGGGKRCMFDGGGICTKSVHGGTSFCVAHGGGKRCAVEGCTKSARGRTDFCVRHGGGKRCKFENCTKSAQGSTDFCKAHGGGKRCAWGQEGSPYREFLKDKSNELFKGPCERFARGKIGLCAAHSALVQDRRVHGAGTMGSALPAGIGPGLFRGLVTGLTPKGNHLESASDASKQPTHGSEDRGEHGSESGGSDSIQKGGADGRPSEVESATMEDVLCHVQGLPQPSSEYNLSFTFTGNFQKETQPLNKMNGGVSIPSNGAASLWPGISSHSNSKGNHVINRSAHHKFFTPSLLTTSNSVDALVLRNQPLGEGTVFRQPLLPPQVLVPLSMQKGEFWPSHGKGRMKHTRISNAGDNGFISTLVHEGRVHGGNTCNERVHGVSAYEERVHGGSACEGRVHGGSVHEKKAHGGCMLALLSENNHQKNS